jgi:hypothetical protein
MYGALMSELDIRVIEIVGTFSFLAIFIVLFALVKPVVSSFTQDYQPWANIAYVLIFLAFTATMSFFGLKLSPRLSQ